MILKVTDYEKQYEIRLEPLTQLYGLNVQRKHYILESLRKYFSGFKYSEEKSKWRDNVFIDDENVGRKYFSVTSISCREDLINEIKISKQSMLSKYIQCLLQDFDWQKHIEIIDEQLAHIFLDLNEKMSEIGPIELNYSTSEIWDMVQSSSVTGLDGINTDELNNAELFEIYIGLLKKICFIKPEKKLLIIENMDHLLERSDYYRFVNEISELTNQSDLYVIITTSLDGYTFVTRNNILGVAVVGDFIFQFDNYEDIKIMIEDNYPYYKKYGDEEFLKCMSKIMHKIGYCDSLMKLSDNVNIKIINDSMLINSRVKIEVNSAEISFLQK